MDENYRLDLLKREIMALGSSVYDPLLIANLHTAEEFIKREGIVLNLDTSDEDNRLVVGYAAWLWRQRENPEMEMPRWLRYNLNNKIFSQKV